MSDHQRAEREDRRLWQELGAGHVRRQFDVLVPRPFGHDVAVGPYVLSGIYKIVSGRSLIAGSLGSARTRSQPRTGLTPPKLIDTTAAGRRSTVAHKTAEGHTRATAPTHHTSQRTHDLAVRGGG